MTDLAQEVNSLARRVRSILDPNLRVGLLRSTLLERDATGLADLVMLTVNGTEARQPGFSDAMLALSVALADDACTDHRRAAAMEAVARGQGDLAQLLMRDEGEESDNPRIPDFGTARPLTLGERKSIARTGDRRVILKAIRDPHPDVITLLLRNPRLTEDDVVRLCAARPTEPAVLRATVQSMRWATRYRVRRTIVWNPHTPLDIGLQFALLLSQKDAREVAESPSIRPEIRNSRRRALRGPDTIH